MHITTLIRQTATRIVFFTFGAILLFSSSVSLYAQEHTHIDCELRTPTPELLEYIRSQQKPSSPTARPTAAPSQGISEISILFLFDESAIRYCTVEQKITLEAFAQGQIGKMNQVLQNSGVTDVKYRIAGIEEIASNYGPVGASSALDYVTYFGRPEFHKAKKRRELSGGDIVLMFIDTGVGAGKINGAAWALQGNPSEHKTIAIAACGVRPSFEGYTAVHEVAHILGCGHSSTQRQNPRQGARHDYSLGYQGVTTTGEYFSTVMAYPLGPNGVSFARIPYFSSPLVKHPNDPNSTTGTAQADNVRTIRQYAKLTSQNYIVTTDLKLSTDFIPAEEDEKSYQVEVTTSDSFTVSANADWITFPKNSFYSGDVVDFTVLKNPDSTKEREAIITLKNSKGETKTIKVQQALSLKTVLDNTELEWTTGGKSNWYGQATVFSSEGKNNAAQSGVLKDGGTNYVETKVVGPGKITFSYKTEVEMTLYGLKMYVNDERARTANGVNLANKIDGQWHTESLEIPQGEHTIKWEMTGRINYEYTAYLDNIRWEYDRNDLILGELSKEIDEKAQTVDVSFRTGKSWTASLNADWITIDKQAGDLGGKITLSVQPNTSRTPRTAILTISNGTKTADFTLTQRSDLLRAGMNAENLDWTAIPENNYNHDLTKILSQVQVWYGQLEEPYDGHATAIFDQNKIPQTSQNKDIVVFTELVGPGTFKFKHKSTVAGGKLWVEVNGNRQEINLTSAWQESQPITIPEGKAVVKFIGQATYGGNGKIYITDVEYTSPTKGIFVEPATLEASSFASEYEAKIITRNTWVSELSADWFSISPETNELGTTSRIKVNANTTGEQREGFILLKTADSFEKIKIIQNADEQADKDFDLNKILPKPGTDPIYFKNDEVRRWTPVFYGGYTINPQGAVKTPKIARYETATITAEVNGAGVLSFDFSTELYHENALVLYVDDVKIAYFHSQKNRSGQQDDNGMYMDRSARSYSTEIKGDGKHTIHWAYERKNEQYAYNGGLNDLAVLENVNFATEQKSYQLTVKNGNGSGYYKENQQVNLIADNAPIGWIFEKWTGDTDVLTNAERAQTTFAMPMKNISLTAVYKSVEQPKQNLTSIVKFESGTFAYDGSPKSIFVTNLPEGVIFTYEGNGKTDVGEHLVKAKFAGNQLYNPIELEAKIIINKATISGVKFENGTFVYDGSPKSIFATNLPEGVTVSYQNNGKTEVGTHPVKALLSGANYNNLELTANLIIVKEETPIVTPTPSNPTVEKFNYYPNPIIDILTINSLENDFGYLYDSAGRLQKQFVLKKGENKISFAELPKGIYLLITQNGEKVKLQK